MQILAAVFALMVPVIIGAEVHGNLETLSSCICLGYEAVFECVVPGDEAFATIWSGTALDRCSNERITLRHSQFNQSEYSLNQTCGDSGLIIFSRAVSVVNNSYISRLIVDVSQSLLGANVQCASDSGSIIGTKQIQLTTAPLPPPSNVMFSLINSSHFTLNFTWNDSVSLICQAVHYKINVNCGQCPNATSCGVTCPASTDTDSVLCGIQTFLATFPETCVITILPVMCGNVSGMPLEFLINGSLLLQDDIVCNQTSTEAPVSEWSLFPNTSTEYKQTFQQSTNLLNIILPGCLLLTVVILIAFVILIMIIYCRHRKQQSFTIAIKMSQSTVNNSLTRDLNHVPKLQQSELIYMEVGPSIEHRQPWIKPDDDRVEYATLNHQHVPKENQPKRDLSTVDKQLDLDNFLIQLRTQLTPKWYQFGLALGLDKDILNKYSECPPEESIVEVADYWLRNSPTKPTWRDAARALKKIGFDLLAEDILNVYKTGNLPVEVKDTS